MSNRLSAVVARLTGRREDTAERRRIERELASFTTESDKAELAAILERTADRTDDDVRKMITDRLLASTEHVA